MTAHFAPDRTIAARAVSYGPDELAGKARGAIRLYLALLT